MPTASRKVRKIRRIKRERTLAFRQLRIAQAQRDHIRTLVLAMEKELLARDKAAKEKGSLTITKVEDETPINPVASVGVTPGIEADAETTAPTTPSE